MRFEGQMSTTELDRFFALIPGYQNHPLQIANRVRFGITNLWATASRKPKRKAGKLIVNNTLDVTWVLHFFAPSLGSSRYFPYVHICPATLFDPFPSQEACRHLWMIPWSILCWKLIHADGPVHLPNMYSLSQHVGYSFYRNAASETQSLYTLWKLMRWMVSS